MGNVFLKLLNMSITAGWLILAVIILRFILRRAPKWIFCLLWALVAVRLVCPVSLESIFSMIPSKETIRRDVVVSDKPAIDSGVKLVDEVVNPVIRKSFTPAPGASVSPLQVWLFIAGIIWSAGVCAMLAYAAVSYLRLRYRVRTAVRLRDNIYISEYIDTPFILGLVKPHIYLPLGMDKVMLEPVISHERAHLKRRDYLWKPLGFVLLAVYWFHPLCWLAYSYFCRDIELACDEKVIKDFDSRQKKAYSEALLACSVNRRSMSACPLSFGEVGVRNRIKSVLHYKKPTFWIILSAIIVCAAAAVCFLTDPVESREGHGTTAGAQDMEASDVRRSVAETMGTDEGENIEAKKITDAEMFLREWTKAFVSRNGNTIAALVTKEALEDLQSRELLTGTQGQRSFGESSPWPMEENEDVLLYNFDDKHAEIYYYAWTSEPHVTVWRESLTYEMRERGYVVTKEEIRYLDNISSVEEFSAALVGGTAIDGTRLDYRYSGAGKALNDNALLSSTTLYLDLFEPESAALALLNISKDEEEVKVERIWKESLKDPFMDLSGGAQEDKAWEENNSVDLEITFLKDNEAVRITMIQSYGRGGIWIPQNYAPSPMYRFMQLDWEQVKKNSLSLDDADWERRTVRIGEIPQKNIAIYGFNDEEWFGRGVAIELGKDVNYFDWTYAAPRGVNIECYWNETDRQLQVALNIYTGTGFDAWELHVLQQHDTGRLTDNVLDYDALSELLFGRIESEYDEAAGRLTLIDKGSGRELAVANMDEGVDGRLELGNISRFILEDSIILRVEPGWYYGENVYIAEYEGMPVLEAEVLLNDSEGIIGFELGDITVKE